MLKLANRMPLSAAQLGVWVAQKIDPANPIFNIAQYADIRGNLNLDLLKEALSIVVREVDALRIGFIETSDDPRQIVHASLDWELPIIEMSREVDPVGAAMSWMKAQLARPAELTEAPLFSYAIVRLSSDRVFWFQRNHHIMNDGFGAWLVARRVADIYSALASGRTGPGNQFRPLSDLLEDERRVPGVRAV